MKPGSGLDVVVVGGGIAGLTAAYHAAVRGQKVALIERELPGGAVVNVGALEGYPSITPPSGAELASALYGQLAELGVDLLMGEVDALHLKGRVKSISLPDQTLRAGKVVLAMGRRLRPLPAKGFSEYWQRGVSQCAFCDAGLFRDKTVVVVGGGDAAMQEALHLTEYASEVVLVHRSNRLRARRHFVEQIADIAKVRFKWSSEIVGIEGDEAVQQVQLKDLKSGAVDALRCAAVFPFIGSDPNTELVSEQLQADESGDLVVTEALETSEAGVYAVGSIRVGYQGQLTNAVSDGTNAAIAIAAA